MVVDFFLIYKLKAHFNLPSLIIGSMVKQCPGFITPMALYSEKNKKVNVENGMWKFWNSGVWSKTYRYPITIITYCSYNLISIL